LCSSAKGIESLLVSRRKVWAAAAATAPIFLANNHVRVAMNENDKNRHKNAAEDDETRQRRDHDYLDISHLRDRQIRVLLNRVLR